MFRTDLVEDSRMRPLEHGPEGFNTVGMGLASNILADTVLDRLMVRQGVIGQGIVGVDLCSGSTCSMMNRLMGDLARIIHKFSATGPGSSGLTGFGRQDQHSTSPISEFCATALHYPSKPFVIDSKGIIGAKWQSTFKDTFAGDWPRNQFCAVHHPTLMTFCSSLRVAWKDLRRRFCY